jgi:hypothetical protein
VASFGAETAVKRMSSQRFMNASVIGALTKASSAGPASLFGLFQFEADDETHDGEED